MGAGVPDFVVVNLTELEKAFEAGSEVTLEAIKAQVLSVSGSEADLPLKVCACACLHAWAMCAHRVQSGRRLLHGCRVAWCPWSSHFGIDRAWTVTTSLVNHIRRPECVVSRSLSSVHPFPCTHEHLR